MCIAQPSSGKLLFAVHDNLQKDSQLVNLQRTKYFESRMSIPQPSCHSSGIYVEERERRLEKSKVDGNFTATTFQSLFSRGTHELTMTVTVIVTAPTRLAQVPDSPNLSMEESR